MFFVLTIYCATTVAVVDAGLASTHLDWHCLVDGGRADVLDLTASLARKYGLVVRVWLDRGRERLRRRGLPVTDYEFLCAGG